MNHKRLIVRFTIVVFWICIIGLASTAFLNSGNAFALSWASWLFYGVIAILVLYLGVMSTIYAWNIE